MSRPASSTDKRRTAAGRSSTLAFLLRRMRRRSDFPAISERILEISRKTANPERTSVNELSNAILSDYALTTKLLKLVNASLYGQYGGRISTISRAVVILGFKQVRMAAQSLLLFEHLGDAAEAETLREAAGQAQMSGILGRALAGKGGLADPEEAFVGSMLRNLGRILTMYYLPEEFTDIQRVMASRGIDEPSAASHVLGLSYEDLGMGIAREWQLPFTLVESMRALPPGRQEPLEPGARASDRLRTVAAFSTELAECLGEPPEQMRERLAELQARFGQCLPVGDEALGELVRAAAEDARSYGAVLDSALAHSPAFRSLRRWMDQAAPVVGGGEPSAAPSPASTADPAQPESAEEPEEGGDTVINGIQDITNALIEGCSLNDVLVMILETIYRGLRFTRVALCVNDRAHQQMIARFALGREIDTLQERFRFAYGSGDDAFSQAVRRQDDIVYPGPRCAPGDLPRWYRKLLSPACAVLLPIVVKGVCFGLIYCDREEVGEPLSGTHLNYLNTLRNQAALAIKQNA